MASADGRNLEQGHSAAVGFMVTRLTRYIEIARKRSRFAAPSSRWPPAVDAKRPSCEDYVGRTTKNAIATY
jgi:hypothetical protein